MKYLAFILTGILTPYSIFSQSLDDAIRFSEYNLTGTARSAAMGNAFGSLGGDFTSLSLNPAGVAIYRSSEVSVTPSFIFSNTSADYSGSVVNDKSNSFPFNQAGFVGTHKLLNDDDKGIISTHFAFGYNRTNNLNEEFTIRGYGIQTSKLSQFVINGEGLTPGQLNDFGNDLAYDVYLLDTLPGINNSYFNAFEGINGNNEVFWRANKGLDQQRVTYRDGYSGEYNFTFGINISNVLMIGASMGITSYHYDESSTYSEYNTYGLDPAFDTDLDYYNYRYYLHQSGTGYNFKFGLIAKPVPMLRLGAAIHSPNYYNIWERWNSSIKAYYLDNFISDSDSPDGEYNYKFRTPMRFTGAASLVLGKYMIISADYEFANYRSTQFKPLQYSDDYFRTLNTQIKQRFKNTNDIKTGIEVKVTPQIGIRGGYSFHDSPYKDEYEARKSEFHTYSAGIGYRTMKFFVDLAYMLTEREYEYFNYNWDSSLDEWYGTPEAAWLTTKDNQIIVTLGYRF